MDINIIERLSDRILKRLVEKKHVEERQMDLFLEQMLQLISSPIVEELPRSFCLLEQRVNKSQAYGEISFMEAEQAFIYGSLASAFQLFELQREQQNKQDSIEVLAKRYLNDRIIFQIVSKRPQIMHSQLSKLSGRTPSELSEFFNKVREERFFSCIRIGQEKYYYLERRGEEVLSKINERYYTEKESIIVQTNRYENSVQESGLNIFGQKSVVCSENLKVPFSKNAEYKAFFMEMNKKRIIDNKIGRAHV